MSASARTSLAEEIRELIRAEIVLALANVALTKRVREDAVEQAELAFRMLDATLADLVYGGGDEGGVR